MNISPLLGTVDRTAGAVHLQRTLPAAPRYADAQPTSRADLVDAWTGGRSNAAHRLGEG